MGVTLGISGASADDLIGSEQIGTGDADDVASMAADRAGRVLWSRQRGRTAAMVRVLLRPTRTATRPSWGRPTARARRPQQGGLRRVGDQIREVIPGLRFRCG